MRHADQRAKKIDRALKLAWDSLQSHLNWTHHISSEGKIFHKKCVKQYAELMKLLSELY